MVLTLLPAITRAELAELGLTALRMEVGARRLGMGMAGSGIINDIFALFNNPGALPWAKGVAVSLKDMSNTSAAQSYPTGFGATLALGVTAGKTESFSTSGGAVNSSSCNSLSLAAGTRLEVGGKNLGVGLTLNSLVGQTLIRPGRIDAAGNGWDLDVGLLYRYSPWLSLGASAHNILPANTLGGGVIRWTNGNRESLPAFYRAGAAARWQAADQEHLLAGDYEYLNLTRQSAFRLGWEWTLYQKYFLRLGFSPDLAWGAGIKFGDWQTDFSISKNPLKDENQIYLSISFYPAEWLILSQPIKRLNLMDGERTYYPSVEAAGEVWPNVKLKINSQPVTIGEDAKFSQTLPLNLGENPLVFESWYEGERSEKKIIIVRDPLPRPPVYLRTPPKIPAAKKVEKPPVYPKPKKIIAPKKPVPPKMLKVLPKKAKPKPSPPPPKPAKPLKIPPPIRARTQLTKELEKFRKEIKERARQEEDQKKFLALQTLLKEKTGFTITSRVKIKLPQGYLAVYQLVDEQYIALRHLGGGRVSIDSYDALEGLWTTRAIVPYSEIANLL